MKEKVLRTTFIDLVLQNSYIHIFRTNVIDYNHVLCYGS